MVKYISNIGNWAEYLSLTNPVFVINELKKKFTPYEMDLKDIDETIYEEGGEYIIDELIQLPNNDILLGCRYCCEEVDKNHTYYLEISNSKVYFKLSEISMRDVSSKYDCYDKRYEGWDEEDEEE